MLLTQPRGSRPPKIRPKRPVMVEPMDWKFATKYPKGSHKQNLVAQAERTVTMDLRYLAAHPKTWQQWQRLTKSLQVNGLNYLLTGHYQRYVRMDNVLKRFRPDQEVAALRVARGDDVETELSLGGSYGKSPFKA